MRRNVYIEMRRVDITAQDLVLEDDAEIVAVIPGEGVAAKYLYVYVAFYSENTDAAPSEETT